MFAYYIRLAWKRAKATPLLVLLAMMSLAVGQAASLAIFTLRHGLVGDPIPAKSERLLTPAIGSRAETDNHFTYAQAASFSTTRGGPLITGQAIGSLSLPDHTRAVNGVPLRYTTWQFFRFFDAPLAKGRGWDASDDAGAVPVAVLGERYARELFPASDALGKTVSLGGSLYRVIGVLGDWDPAPRFYDLSLGAYMGSDAAYLPLSTIRYAPDDLGVPMTCTGTAGQAAARPRDLLAADCKWLVPWFLAGDAGSAHDMRRALASEMRLVLPDMAPGSRPLVLNVRQMLAASDLLPGSVKLFTALAVAFFVLCVANAAGMELSRLLKRTSETGIRRALGARRIDILYQYLAEALLLGGASGVVGAVLAEAGLAWIRRLPSFYTRTAYMDAYMWLLLAVLAFACCMLVGMVPALIASRTDPASAIRAQP